MLPVYATALEATDTLIGLTRPGYGAANRSSGITAPPHAAGCGGGCKCIDGDRLPGTERESASVDKHPDEGHGRGGTDRLSAEPLSTLAADQRDFHLIGVFSP